MNKNKMNFFEKTAFNYGKARAQISRGWDSVVFKSWNDPSVSDPTAWLDPDRWGAALAEGRKPQTKGEFIEAFTSWVFICVKMKGQAVASVPMKLYVAKEKRGQKFKLIETKAVSKQKLKWLYSNEGLEPWLAKAEEIEEVTDHVFLTLMREVNPWNNRRDLWETTSMFLDLTGETYWWLPKTNLQVPARIWVIPSQFMTPKPGKTLDDAIESYKYRRAGVETTIPEDEIILFASSNPNNPFTGYSTVKAIADAIYIQSQMNEFEASLFENKARPGGILIPKSKMSRAERERTTESFRQKFAGARKAGKTLIPPSDMDFIRDAMTPEEISYIEGRRLVRTEIMASLDVPEGMIITESSNRAVAEAAEYIFAKYGVLPRCKKIEEKLNEKLVSRYDEKLFCAFDDPVPENRELKLKEDTEYIKVGAISRDEIRAGIGKEPRGGMADELLVDNRLVPITSGPAGKQAELFLKKIINAAKEILG